MKPHLDAPPGQAMAFLAALVGCAGADAAAVPVTFQTFDDEKPGGRGRHELTRMIHGNLAQDGAELGRLNRAGAGIFVAVNGTDGTGRKKANVRTLRAWWCDVDAKGARELLDLDRLPLAPSMVVRTPGGWHLYWIADSPMLCGDDARRSKHEAEVKAIAQALAPFGGDLKACDVARVLRVPGFLHRKDEPSPVTLEKVDGPRYTREQIQAAFPPPASKMRATEAPPAPEWLAPPQRVGILKRAGAYLDKLEPAIAGQGGHAATFDAALKILSGFDLSEDEALSLMLERFNPRCEPLWSVEELRHKVQDAAAHAKSRGRLLDESRNRKALPPTGSQIPVPPDEKVFDIVSSTNSASSLGRHQAPAPPSGSSDRPAVPGFEWRARGLFKVTVKPGRDGEEAKEEAEWIAPPFTLPGLVRDEVSHGWRLLVAWKDLDEVEHEEAVPFELLSGEGLELGRTLGQGGLLLPPDVGARKHLLRYLCRAHHKVRNRVRLVGALGWHEGAFVLPTGQAIGQAGEVLRYAGDAPGHRASSTGGTLDGWRAEVARYAVGNPRLAFAVARWGRGVQPPGVQFQGEEHLSGGRCVRLGAP